MLGIIQSIVVVFTLFAFVVSVCAQLIYLGLSRYFPGLSPDRRARLFFLLACSPVFISFVLVVLVFIPSFLTLIGVVADHCLIHGDHHSHLCFIHPPAFIHNPWTLTFSFTFLVISLWRMVRASSVVWKGQKLLNQLRRNGTKQIGDNFNLLESNLILAYSMGFLRPEIFLSTALLKELNAEELQVIIAHERAHAERQDFLHLFLANILSVFFIPIISRNLLSDLVLASEQACDLAATQGVSNSILVAKTIVKVQSLMPECDSTFAGVVHFSKSHIEQRVVLLLEHEKRGPLHNGIFPKYIFIASMFFLLLFNNESFHHYVETFYFFIFQ